MRNRGRNDITREGSFAGYRCVRCYDYHATDCTNASPGGSSRLPSFGQRVWSILGDIVSLHERYIWRLESIASFGRRLWFILRDLESLIERCVHYRQPCPLWWEKSQRSPTWPLPLSCGPLKGATYCTVNRLSYEFPRPGTFPARRIKENADNDDIARRRHHRRRHHHHHHHHHTNVQYCLLYR